MLAVGDSDLKNMYIYIYFYKYRYICYLVLTITDADNIDFKNELKRHEIFKEKTVAILYIK